MKFRPTVPLHAALILAILISHLWVFDSASASKNRSASQQAEIQTSQIAFIGQDGNVWLVRMDGSDLIQLTFDASGDITYSTPAWSPDGYFLFYIRATGETWELHAYDFEADNGQVLLAGMSGNKGLTPNSVSPDGQQLVFVHGSSCLAILDLDLLNYQDIECIQNEPNEPPSLFQSPAFSLSGDSIVFNWVAHESLSIGIYHPSTGIETIGTGSSPLYYGGENTLAVFLGTYFSNRIPEIAGQKGIFLFDPNQGTYTPFLTFEDEAELPSYFSFSEDGNQVLYHTGNVHLGNGQIVVADLLSGNTQVMIAGTQPAWRPGIDTDPILTGWIAYLGTDDNVWLVQEDGSNARQLTFNAGERETADSNPTRYKNLKWSPDGVKLGFVQENSVQVSTGVITYRVNRNNILVYDLETGKTEQVLSYVETSGGFDWLGDSHLIYDRPWTAVQADGMCTSGYSQFDGLYLLDLETGQSQQAIPTPSQSPLYRPVASPTGDHVIFEYLPEPPYAIYFPNYPLHLASLADPTVFHPLQDMLADCAWSPDGSRFACASWTEDCIENERCPIQVYAANGQVVEQLAGAASSFDYHPLWSPDGRAIAFNATSKRGFADGPCGGFTSPSSENPAVNIISLVDKQRRVITSGVVLGWSPDGNKLLVKRGNGLLEDQEIYIVQSSDGQETFLAQGREAAWQPQPVDLAQLVERKTATIQTLESTTFTNWGGTITETIEAFEENPAKTLVQEVENGLEFSPSQIAAFDRLVLQEETLARILPAQTLVARNMAESAVDFLGLAWSTAELLKGAAPLPLQKAILPILAEFIEAYVQFSDDPIIQGEISAISELVLNAVTQDNITNLEGIIAEMILGNFIRKDATSRFIQRYVDQVEPALTQGVNSVWMEGDYWPVAGNLQSAMIQMEHLGNTAENASQSSTSMLEDIRRGMEVNDVFMEIGNLATSYGGGSLLWTTTINITTRVLDTLMILWGDSISQKAYACINRVSLAAGEKAFNPSSQLVTCPELADLDSLPPWLEKIFSLPLWGDLSNKIRQVSADALGLSAAISDGNLDQVSIAYQDFEDSFSAVKPLLEAAKSAITLTDGDARWAVADSLYFGLIRIEMNLTMIDLAANALVSQEIPPGEAQSLLQKHTQSLQNTSAWIESYRSKVPDREDGPASQLVVLHPPSFFDGIAGDQVPVQLGVANYGTLPAAFISVSAELNGETIFTSALTALDPNQSQMIEASFTAPESGTYFVTITLDDGLLTKQQIVPLIVEQAPESPQEDESAVEMVDQPSQNLLDSQWFAIALLAIGLLATGVGILGWLKYRKSA